MFVIMFLHDIVKMKLIFNPIYKAIASDIAPCLIANSSYSSYPLNWPNAVYSGKLAKLIDFRTSFWMYSQILTSKNKEYDSIRALSANMSSLHEKNFYNNSKFQCVQSASLVNMTFNPNSSCFNLSQSHLTNSEANAMLSRCCPNIQWPLSCFQFDKNDQKVDAYNVSIYNKQLKSNTQRHQNSAKHEDTDPSKAVAAIAFSSPYSVGYMDCLCKRNESLFKKWCF